MTTNSSLQIHRPTVHATPIRGSHLTARRRFTWAGLALLTSSTLFGTTCAVRARDASVDASKSAFIGLLVGGLEDFLTVPGLNE